MKKFLSVLLALAVAFTFTFGSSISAFALTKDEAATAALKIVNATQEAGSDAITENDDVKVTYTDGKTMAVDAANWQLAYADAFAALQKAVGENQSNATTAQDVLQAAGVTVADEATDAAMKTAVIDYLTNSTTGKTYTSNSAAKAIVPQTEVVLANAKLVIAGVDTSIYSTTVVTADEIEADAKYLQKYLWADYAYSNGSIVAITTAESYTAKGVADSIVKSVSDKLAAVSTDEIKTIDAAKAARKAIDDAFAGYISVTGDTNNDYVEAPTETITTAILAQSSKSPMTTAKETADNYAKNNAVAVKLATISSNIAAVKASEAYTALKGNDKDAYDAELAAYEIAMTYLANNNGTIADAPAIGSTVNGTNVEIANTAKAVLETLKAAKNEDGSVTYDAEQLDKNLVTVLSKIYTVSDNAYTAATKTELKNALIGTGATDATITYVTNATKAGIKAAVKAAVGVDATGNYVKINSTDEVAGTDASEVYFYDLEFDAVKAAVEKFNAAVDAANTDAEIAEAKAALNKAVKDLNNVAEVNALYTATGAVKTAAEAEFDSLKAYAVALQAAQAAKDSTDPLVFDITDITPTAQGPSVSFDEGTLYAFYIANNARTASEVKALNATVKAVLDSAKTNNTLIAEANAVVAQIKALPTTVALTDKDAVAAASKAYEDLNPAYQKYVTNKATLDKAIVAVQTAEKNAILTAVKALPTTATVTVADKAAVQAVVDAIDAYNDTEMYTTDRNYSNATVTGLLTKIQNLEYAALKAAVEAIPAADKITTADKDAIEAARAAYDAYVAEYADTLNTAQLNALEATLTAAEKALAAAIDAAPKYTDVNAKADLLDMSRKITIWRTSKTSIKVTAVGSVANITDNGYTVEYKFYKKAPGAKSYKLVKTTSSNKYTYKNLKKGTNKFQVKVVVKDADGKVVASKMTYYRAAKVK